jgi:hypothetical protein
MIPDAVPSHCAADYKYALIYDCTLFVKAARAQNQDEAIDQTKSF